MAESRIHPDTRWGHVHLTVSDLERALSFYESSLGFRTQRREGNTAFLGAGRDPLLALTEDRQARPRGRATGMYHFAILVPSRLDLAYVLRNMAAHDLDLGFGDHYVSEAIYLSDPDGNGIEIYRDRPRNEWPYRQGRLVMGTEMVDVQGLLGELQGQPDKWEGLDSQTVLGHMHLQVARLAAAEAFYRDVIGFDVTVNLGTASFLSAGGYHHHMGINTWGTAGAPPPPEGAIGLRYAALVLPNVEALHQVAVRVRGANVTMVETPEGLLVHDPSQNALVLTSERVAENALPQKATEPAFNS